MAWRPMGFARPYYNKGQFGSQVVWVGYEVTDVADTIQVHINQVCMKGLEELTQGLAQIDKVKLKDLRSYAGKANHVAIMIWAERPLPPALAATLEKAVQRRVPLGDDRFTALVVS